MKNVLTIAGADPSGGAGIQSDILTFASFGVNGLSVITSLTAQNNKAVKGTLAVPAPFLSKQVNVLLEEFTIHAVKIGMIGTEANVKALGRLFRSGKLKNIVLDTVLRSTSDFPLLDDNGVKAVRKLLPLVRIATPNTIEASILSGISVDDTDGMEEAAKIIFSMGAENVLVKGGHLKGSPVDILYDGKRFFYFEGKRLKGKKERFHGTGCILSAGIAAGLAKGWPVKKAAAEAKTYLNKVLKNRQAI